VSDLPIEEPRGISLTARAEGFKVALRDVTYRYPGAPSPSLRGVNLAVNSGEKVGIVGADGAGQSTLLRVMSGLLEGYEGTITFDGVTLRDLDQRGLRAQVGQMLSLTDLFDGTIEENVTVGRPDVSTDDVLRALERAALAEQVQAMPLGLRTPVSAGGGSLSVSNAKKLLLAQAIVGHPRILLLEDIVQDLEGEAREAVIRMLTDDAAGWTLVIVTHDPALLAACDRVVVLQDGTVALEGPFAELHQAFWTLYLAQRDDAELLTVIQPWLAWRVLVLASPEWYPTIADATRRQLMRFAFKVMAEPRYAWAEVNRYLEAGA
jgi:ABC-type bacteriocin/lantibiotic exporter with double-glycine peptidase domain